MTVELSILGDFRLTRDGAPVDLRNRKAQALLVYLALTGKPQPRETLATLLWGDRFDDQARRSLRQALHALRAAIGPDIIAGEQDLHLVAGALTVEAGETGQLLPAFRSGAAAFDDWLETRRRDHRARAAQSLADQAEADPAHAVDLLRQALALDPFDEARQRALMSALAAEGRRADALAAYTRFAERLRAELDAAPAEETQALAQQLREGRAPNPLAAQFTAPAPGDKANALIAGFDDQGGGDLAAFFAAELPSEIAMRTRALNLVTIMPAAQAGRTDPAEEARARGAQCVISGGARQIGDRVRLSARIQSASGDATVWNETAIFPEAEAFEAIGDFATSVTRGLARFVAGVGAREDRIRKLNALLDDPEAVRTAMQNYIWYAFFVEQTRALIREGAKVMRLASERFPQVVEFQTWLAFNQFHTGHLCDGEDKPARYREARETVERALAIDPGHNLTLGAKIIVNTWLGDFDAADAAYQALVGADSPFHAHMGLYAVSMVFRGRMEEALPLLTESIELERGTPLLFYRYAILGLGRFMQADDAAALVAANNALLLSREFFLAHLVRIAALEGLGRHADAMQALAEMRADYRDPTLAEFRFLPIQDTQAKDRLFTALAAAGMAERPEA